ncbi:MAG: hypothetical protein FWE15_20055 [Actinomycetia bacterium]|nr:hypothetical protein [Actinomycetes bacterium]
MAANNRSNKPAGDKADGAKPGAGEDGLMLVRVEFAVKIDPAAWPAADAEEVDPGKIAEALTKSGIPGAQVEAMVAKLTAGEDKPAGARVREELRQYMAAEVAKLPKLAEAGATVELKAPYRKPKAG